MPYPQNLDHHFVVDPTKFDFYAVDCYRHLAEARTWPKPSPTKSSKPALTSTAPNAPPCD